MSLTYEDDHSERYFPSPSTSGTIEGPGRIGQDFQVGGLPFDWQRTVISQYANSPRLMDWVANFAVAIDQNTDLDSFYDLLWNIQTCSGYGLDVWGRIVVINRTLKVTTRFFGYEEGLPDFDPFNTSPFYTGGPTQASFTLGDDAYRLLIIAKAAANISYGSIPAINHILDLLFPNRLSYIQDNQDLTMTYVFDWNPSPVELAIIETSNVLPRIMGVRVLYSVGAVTFRDTEESVVRITEESQIRTIE